eukprot:10550103-Alexandrium_andersonii.AAC.1
MRRPTSRLRVKNHSWPSSSTFRHTSPDSKASCSPASPPQMVLMATLPLPVVASPAQRSSDGQ